MAEPTTMAMGSNGVAASTTKYTPCTQAARNIGIALAVMGVALIIVASCIPSHVMTRTDFIATPKSSIPGDSSISEKVTQYTDPSAFNTFLGIAFGCGTASLLLLAVAIHYCLQARAAKAEDVSDDRTEKATQQERVKSCNNRAMIAALAALFLLTMCLGSTMVLAKTTSTTVQSMRFDARYIWTYCGGWVKAGTHHSELLNVGVHDAMLNAGIALASIGGGVALLVTAVQMARARYQQHAAKAAAAATDATAVDMSLNGGGTVAAVDD